MTKYEKLITCRRTVLEMLSDRDHNIDKYLNNKGDIDDISVNQIKIDYNENNLKIQINEENETLCVLFYEEKIGIEMMKEIINNVMKEQKISHLILVIREKLTSFAKKELNNIPPNFQIEVFLQQNVLFNVTHHIKVPKHQLIQDNEQIKNILEIYGKGLPKITKSDPLSRYYNGKIGQIFKIYRQSTIYYRQIINDIDK